MATPPLGAMQEHLDFSIGGLPYAGLNQLIRFKRYISQSLPCEPNIPPSSESQRGCRSHTRDTRSHVFRLGIKVRAKHRSKRLDVTSYPVAPGRSLSSVMLVPRGYVPIEVRLDPQRRRRLEPRLGCARGRPWAFRTWSDEERVE